MVLTRPLTHHRLEDSAKGPAESKDADPFKAMDQAKAKEDFESAFASFKSSQAKSSSSPADAANAFTTFNSEFPPISELERDDDSDSDDGHRGGFDDDFAPASPPAKREEKAMEPKPVSPTLSKSAPENTASSSIPVTDSGPQHTV
jgi:epidermal growth factor receptor substrate 15